MQPENVSTNVSLVRALMQMKETGKSEPDEALELLKRIGPLVKPIVENHGQSLPGLVELFSINRDCYVSGKALTHCRD